MHTTDFSCGMHILYSLFVSDVRGFSILLSNTAAPMLPRRQRNSNIMVWRKCVISLPLATISSYHILGKTQMQPSTDRWNISGFDTSLDYHSYFTFLLLFYIIHESYLVLTFCRCHTMCPCVACNKTLWYSCKLFSLLGRASFYCYASLMP